MNALDHFILTVADWTAPITIVDPDQPDSPLIFVNRAFETLSGYSADNVKGHNCRFMQGDQPRDEQETDRLKACLKAKTATSVCIPNETASGRRFYNYLHVAPLRLHDRILLVGTQFEVTPLAYMSYLRVAAEQRPLIDQGFDDKDEYITMIQSLELRHKALARLFRTYAAMSKIKANAENKGVSG